MPIVTNPRPSHGHEVSPAATPIRSNCVPNYGDGANRRVACHQSGRYGWFGDAMSSTNDRRVVMEADCQADQKKQPVTDRAAVCRAAVG